jgi:trk system potassium uptake protein
MEKLAISEADYGKLARMLHKVDFFAPLTLGQLEKVLPYILLYRYKAGEKVFGQGQPGDAFYIVYDGKVNVKVKEGFFSFAKKVADLKEGDFFGEMALLSRDPRNATVVCEEPARLFVLTSADFDYILKRNPAFATEVARIAERRKFASNHDA